jgi:hypothetical protein
MTDTLLARIIALKKTPLCDLKRMWRALFNTDPPTYSRPWLESRLAYRIQELALGGLSQKTLALLEDLGEQAERDKKTSARRRRDSRPLTGTRLIREVNGTAHEVTVHLDSYEYRGQRYKSLSAIARVITGTSWNGPLFFGFRPARRKS